MPEYPDNSHSARENTSPPSKRVEKVVNGTAKTRKQSEVKKFAGIFMPDEVGDVKTFIITDVVILTFLYRDVCASQLLFLAPQCSVCQLQVVL